MLNILSMQEIGYMSHSKVDSSLHSTVTAILLINK